MWKDFKAFVFRGNVMDMAIGVVIATAFTAIVNSLVKDIIMPCIGMLTANVDFAELKYVMKDGVVDAATGEITGEVAISYGLLINAIIQFVIVAAVIFLVVKLISSAKTRIEARTKTAEAETAPVAPEIPADIMLLTEIRDLLKAQEK